MRAQYPLGTLLSAAALLAACESNTGPTESIDDTGVTILNVAPSFSTIEGRSVTRLKALMAGSGKEPPLELVTWVSSDTNVATVARGGLVEGRKAGRVLITATYASAQGSATVVVLDQVTKKPVSPPCLASGSDAALAIPDQGGKC
jgi:hypothetical protein